MSKLVEFYQHLVDLCGISIGAHGRLEYRMQDQVGDTIAIPLSYDEKPIVFPEKHYLSDSENQKNIIVLHPLCESFIRAPSEVQDVLRKAAIVRLCDVGDFILQRAITINHNATMDTNIKLTPKLASLFEGIDGVDVKFATWFEKLEKAMQENTSYRLFNINIRMHGEVAGIKYDRVCVISSPLYDELVLAQNTTIFGVEGARKKDIATLTRILDCLFPQLQSGGYVAGSSSGVAPTLLSFMEALSTITTCMNNVLRAYGKEAKGISNGTTRGGDFDRDLDFSALRNAHPIEDYNIGVGKDSAQQEREREREVVKEEPKQPTVTATRKVEALEVPIRSASASTDRLKEVNPKEVKGDLPENSFWMRDDRDYRDDRRDDRRRDDRRDDRRYDDDRYYDDRRDRRDDRYERDRYDDRDRRDRDRYDDRRRDDRRYDDRRYDDRRRDDRRDRDYRDDRRDYRRDHDDRNDYGGQFWE